MTSNDYTIILNEIAFGNEYYVLGLSDNEWRKSSVKHGSKRDLITSNLYKLSRLAICNNKGLFTSWLGRGIFPAFASSLQMHPLVPRE